MDALNELILAAATSSWLLPIMVLVAMIDAVFPPIPSETLLIAAAAAAASGGHPFVVVALCLAAASGAAVGDNLAYALGRALGTERFGWMRRPRVRAAFAYAQRRLSRNGATLIIGARFVPVGRVAVNISAGALGYPWRRFWPVSLIGGATWAVYSAGVGMVAGSWFHGSPVLAAAVGVVLAVAIGLIVDRISAQRQRAADAANAATGPEAHPGEEGVATGILSPEAVAAPTLR